MARQGNWEERTSRRIEELPDEEAVLEPTEEQRLNALEDAILLLMTEK